MYDIDLLLDVFAVVAVVLLPLLFLLVFLFKILEFHPFQFTWRFLHLVRTSIKMFFFSSK